MSLWMHPNEATLAGMALGSVRAVYVDRRTARSALEWSDAGPEVVFADAPEQRVDVTIVREADGAGLGFAPALAPGATGLLSFVASPNGSDANRVRVEANVVVLSVEHALRLERASQQTVRCVAVSADGAQDPVTETEVNP